MKTVSEEMFGGAHDLTAGYEKTWPLAHSGVNREERQAGVVVVVVGG